MLKRKIALTLAGLLAANVAVAVPGFSAEAPQSSVETCVAAVDENADFANATTVVHNVETEERRISGHKMAIRTVVLSDDETVIREYASSCSINGQDQIKRFKMREKGE
jgi:hypothetical protein